MAIGASTTYDKARDEALKALGLSGAAPLDPDVLDTQLLFALEQIYSFQPEGSQNRVWMDPHYAHTWTLTVAAGERNPGDAVVTTVFDPMYRIIERAVKVRSGKSDLELIPTDTHPDDEIETDGNPSVIHWYQWGDEFWITPYSDVEETYKFRGYREPDRTLYTISSGTKTWATLDVPDAYVEIYVQMLAGLIANLLGDDLRAQQWISLATDGLTNILERNAGRAQQRPAPVGPIYMGKKASKASNYGPGPVLWFGGD